MLNRKLLISLVVILGIVGAACQAQATATLIHEYIFSGSTVTDSVGSIDGTLQNGATVSGGVLNLSDTAFAELSGMAVPTGLTAFSVTLDALASLPLSSTFAEMISQGSSGGPGFYIGYDPSHNFRFTDQFLSTSVAFPSDGLFHNYALTSDATGTNFYIDAVLSFSDAGQLSPGSSGSNTRFGNQFAPFNEFLTGEIDNVRIYTGALTATEVAGAGPSGVPEPSTIFLLGSGLVVLAAWRRKYAA